MELITINQLNSVQFYQFPKAFTNNPKYIPMKAESKIAYSILRDLLTLSAQNGWVNELGQVYVKLSREKLMLKLNVKGTQKMAQIMKELEAYKLIVYKKIGLNKCNEIYLAMPDELGELYSDDDLLNDDEDMPSEALSINGSLKIKPQEVRKSNLKKFENQTHINTNSINTNINKTNNKQQQHKKVVVVTSTTISPSTENTISDELIDAYKNCFDKKPTKTVQRQLARFLIKFEFDAVEMALQMASSKGKDFDYAIGIMKKWQQVEAFSIDAIVEYDMAYEAGRI